MTSSPQTTAAPQIVNLPALVDAFYKAFLLPPDTENQVYDWLQQIGFIDFYNNAIQPLIDALALGYPMDIGFAGTAAKTGAGRAAGLATLAGDAFGGGPRMPMIPGT